MSNWIKNNNHQRLLVKIKEAKSNQSLLWSNKANNKFLLNRQLRRRNQEEKEQRNNRNHKL